MTPILFRLTLAVLLAACLGLSSLAAQANSLLGMKLADAQKLDVFTHFHFHEVERNAAKNGDTIVSYATECMGNYPVLSVIVVGKEETIRLATLVLQRKFVDEPKLGVFARDLAKSFLVQAVPEADLPAVKTLISEIAFGGQNPAPEKIGKYTMSVVAGAKTDGGFKEADRSSIPRLPEKPTPGYSTYLGKQKEFSQNNSKCKVYLINSSSSKMDSLAIAVDEPDKKEAK